MTLYSDGLQIVLQVLDSIGIRLPIASSHVAGVEPMFFIRISRLLYVR